MTDHLKPALDQLERQRAEQLANVAAIEQAINVILKSAGQAERYQQRSQEASASLTSIQADTFYGRGLSTVAREYLAMRRAANLGPATVNEIYAALVQGGYKFDTKSDDNARRVLRITLTKNSAIFHKLPNGSYGLMEWYPNAKAPKKGSAEASVDVEADDDESEPAPAVRLLTSASASSAA